MTHKLLFMWLWLVASALSLNAQTSHREHDHEQGICLVETPKGKKASKRIRAIARYEEGQTTDFVANNGYYYVYRLAVCVTPDIFAGDFQSDKTKVHQWWDELERDLERFYLRDVGIRLKVVRDDNLIMKENTTGLSEQNYREGTKIINHLIGSDAYEIGILITSSSSNLNGIALLSGVASKSTKADAKAIRQNSTIAHELGHLFGASHTHQDDKSNFTEPGFGQSLMSYSASPRVCFAMSSIRTMRYFLSRQNYYTDSTRQPDKMRQPQHSMENDNMPYVEKSDGIVPLLDKDKIYREYVVSEGTNFQFYLPTLNGQGRQFLYRVHPYDPTASRSQANPLKPVYPPREDSCVMFQTTYEPPRPFPVGPGDATVLLHSGDSRVGSYHFMLGVSDRGNYDTYKVRLRIVKGEAFASTTAGLKLGYEWGAPIALSWKPCHELYGKNSRVRILLSADFGETYPYVLADDVPNNGAWSGTLPYLTIDTYLPEGYKEGIRGGQIKIEVKGEAAFTTVWKNQPYRYERKALHLIAPEPEGGFTLTKERCYVFFEHAPAPFVTIKSMDDLPEIPELRAYYQRNSYKEMGAKVKGRDTREGCIVRRTWTATVSGYTSTYTQIFRLAEPRAEGFAVQKAARALSTRAHALYYNEGQLGYPKPTLPLFGEFKVAYAEVFDLDKQVRPAVTEAQVAALRHAVEGLAEIGDAEVVQPQAGSYYKLRSYHNRFDRERFWYLHKEGTDETFTEDASQATSWLCRRVGEHYVFTDDQGETPHLQGLTVASDPQLTLERGYTWGAFTLVGNGSRAFQLNYDGGNPYVNTEYGKSPISYRTNNVYNAVSTDFQWVLDESRPPIVTHLRSVRGEQSDGGGEVYDLGGRAVAKPRSGVYLRRDGSKAVYK